MDLHPAGGTSRIALDLVDVNARTRSLAVANDELVARIATLDRQRADLIERAGRGPHAAVSSNSERERRVGQFGS